MFFLTYLEIQGLPKKTKFIKYPLIAFFAPQLQQNLAAIVADLEAGIQNLFRTINVPSKLSVATLLMQGCA